jgi:hypothetical protein
MSLVIEHLSIKALSSNPSTTKKQGREEEPGNAKEKKKGRKKFWCAIHIGR